MEKLQPTEQEQGSCPTKRLPAIDRCVPISSFSCRVFSSTCATAAIEAKASPRNPIVRRANRSSAFRIFEVA